MSSDDPIEAEPQHPHQYGVIDVYADGFGWYELPVFESRKVDNNLVEIQTPDGWGALNLVPPSNANTPVEVYCGQTLGWMGVHSDLYRIIDSWERAGFAHWPARFSSSSLISYHRVESSAARHGEYFYRVKVDGTSGSALILSMPGDGLENYPRVGDTMQIYFRYSGADDPVAEISYGVQSRDFDYKNPNLHSSAYHPRVRSSNFAIRYTRPNNGTTRSIAETSWDPTLYDGQWLVMEATWGETTQEATLRTASGTHIATISGQTYSWEQDYDKGGVSVRGGTATGPDTATIDFDRFAIV